MTRGLVVPLTAEQRVRRLLYLAGEASTHELDPYIVLRGDTQDECPAIYYRLKDFNGGKDPTATDPAVRWRKPGSTLENVTCDCMGAQAWAGGFDRYQPYRFVHVYGGWINTDSMRIDAGGAQRCFVKLDRPEPGCMVVFAAGAGGHAVGHVGGVIEVPAEYAPEEREWWRELGVVDVAARIGRANRRTTGLAWYDQDPWFVRSIMTP